MATHYIFTEEQQRYCIEKELKSPYPNHNLIRKMNGQLMEFEDWKDEELYYSSPVDFLEKKCKKRDIIYEGLISTYPPQKTQDILKRKLNYVTWVEYWEHNTTNRFRVCAPPDKNAIQQVISCMDSCGWVYNSNSSKIPDIDKAIENHKQKHIKENMCLFFSPKFDTEEVTPDVYKGNYYHLSPHCYEKKILKNGLEPRSNDEDNSYPARIYLMEPTKTEKDIQLLATQLFNRDAHEYKYKSSLILFSVDVQNWFDYGTTPQRLFRDAHANNCVYTMENIQPQFIKKIREYQFEKETGRILRTVNF